MEDDHLDGTTYINAMVGNNYRKIDCGNELEVWHMDLKGVPPLLTLQSQDASHYVSTGTRKCYDAVFQKLTMKVPPHAPIPNVLVVSNPGIGKSRSIMYVLRRLLVEHCTRQPLDHNTLVAVIDDQESDMVCGIVWYRDGAGNGYWRVCSCHKCDIKSSMCGGLKSNQTFYIVNSANNDTTRQPAAVGARVLFVCSPNRDHYRSFQKNSVTVFMPMWELDELICAYEQGLGDPDLTFRGQTAAQYYGDSAHATTAALCHVDTPVDTYRDFKRHVIRYRYDRVGGAIRYVLFKPGSL